MEYLLERFLQGMDHGERSSCYYLYELKSGNVYIVGTFVQSEEFKQSHQHGNCGEISILCFKLGFSALCLIVGGIVYYLMRMYQSRVKLQASLTYEQRHLQDIERLNQNKLRFFTSISHEFRTPLTLIQGAVERLNELGDLPVPAYKQLSVLNRNSMNLRRLIDQLLDLENFKMMY